MAIQLQNVIKTAKNLRTGTTVDKAISTAKEGFRTNASSYAYGKGNAKLITYGEGTAMKKMGIDQVLIHNANGEYPHKYVEFFNGDKAIYSDFLSNGKEAVADCKNFIQTLKNLAANGIKLS